MQNFELPAIASSLKSARRSAGITQGEMAEACGLSRNHISTIERGLSMPSAKTLLVYSQKCHKTVEELMGMKTNGVIPELQAKLSKMAPEQVLSIISLL